MEPLYVLVRVSHSTRLITQVPTELADWIGVPLGGSAGGGGRTLAFLQRKSGVLRVVSAAALREEVAVESVRGRLVATAQVGERGMFCLPARAAAYLRLAVTSEEGGVRRTVDRLAWFVPKEEYRQALGASTASPRDLPPAAERHAYLSRAEIPLSWNARQLSLQERAIEKGDWPTARARFGPAAASLPRPRIRGRKI